MPCRNLTLKARTDRQFVRSTYRSNRFVLAQIKAPHSHREENGSRPPVNLAFALDRSGSMSGEKIRMAKAAVEQSIARLAADDRFSIVVYDNAIDVVFDSELATPDAKRRAMLALNAIESRGSTNLGEGWLRGCAQVAGRLASDGVNRCLLLTDGLANVGMTDHDELSGHASALRQRGVSTTTFGVGTDFDEALLQSMANAGGGNFYYIANEGQIVDYVTSEVGEALDVVAREVELEVVTPDGVAVEALSPFPSALIGGRFVVSLGSMVAEQLVEVVLRLNFPYGQAGRETGAVLSVAARDAAPDDGETPSVALAWKYAEGKVNDAQARDVEVDRAVARVFAARARQEATALNRGGDYRAARSAIAGVVKRIRTYAGRDPEMRALVSELESRVVEVAEPMRELDRKEMFFRSYAEAKTRMPDGKATRGRP
jgi:Ca-activated chloride channel homolog